MIVNSNKFFHNKKIEKFVQKSKKYKGKNLVMKGIIKMFYPKKKNSKKMFVVDPGTLTYICEFYKKNEI